MNTPDIPTLIRWLTIEIVCAWIMNRTLIITDPRFVGTILGEEHFTTRGIVLAGLAGVFKAHQGTRWWATDPTSADDIAKWGPICRVTSLAYQVCPPPPLLLLLYRTHPLVFRSFATHTCSPSAASWASCTSRFSGPPWNSSAATTAEAGAPA